MPTRRNKRLEQMRANPAGDWSIADVRAVCNAHGVTLREPSNGSHYKVLHESSQDILTVPARRPIKAIYIKKLVKFIDAVRDHDTKS
jgi:hypothetical protein